MLLLGGFVLLVPSILEFISFKLSEKNFPNAVKYAETSISLPSHQFINKKMIEFVSKIIQKNIK